MADDAKTKIYIDEYGRRRNDVDGSHQGKPPDAQAELKAQVEALKAQVEAMQAQLNQLDIAATKMDIQSPDHNVDGNFRNGFRITAMNASNGGLQPGQVWLEVEFCDLSTAEVIARNVTPPP